MQRIKVKEVRGPFGNRGNLFTIQDDTGNKFSTFDKKVEGIAPGTVLEIEFEAKGGYLNIKKWSVVEESTSAESSTKDGPGRLAFDAKVNALMVAGDLACAGHIKPDCVLEIAESYRGWLMGESSNKAIKKHMTTTEEDWEDLRKDGPGLYKRDLDTIKTHDECLKACKEDFNMQPNEVYAELNVNNYKEFVDLPKKPVDQYKYIAAVRSGPR